MLFGSVQLWSWRVVERAKAWPLVEAIVTDSRVISWEAATLGRHTIVTTVRERLVFRFAYSVAGHHYASKRFYAYGRPDSLGATKQYPRGQHFMAHYNPGKPDQAVVEPGFSDHHARVAWVIFLGVLIVTVIYDRRGSTA